MQHQQQADGHRRHRLLVCAFYPWLECSLHRLHTQKVCLQPEIRYSGNAESRCAPPPGAWKAADDCMLLFCCKRQPLTLDGVPDSHMPVSFHPCPVGILHSAKLGCCHFLPRRLVSRLSAALIVSMLLQRQDRFDSLVNKSVLAGRNTSCMVRTMLEWKHAPCLRQC